MVRPRNAFYPNKITFDGLSSNCKTCTTTAVELSKLRKQYGISKASPKDSWSPAKTCTHCKQLKPRSAFSLKKAQPNSGLRSYCRSCTNLAQRNSALRNPIAHSWRRLKCSKHPVKISSSTFQVLLKQPCYYCGRIWQADRDCGSYWLDRIDNSKGYSKGNVLPACGQCNTTRMHQYSVEETKVMITALLEYRANQVNSENEENQDRSQPNIRNHDVLENRDETVGTIEQPFRETQSLSLLDSKRNTPAGTGRSGVQT